MFLLVICGLEEKRSNLLIAFLLCYRRKVGIFISCLGFSCKGSLQILLCLCSGIGIRRLRIRELLKGTCRLLAYRAGKILRKGISLVDITTNLTFPFSHVVFSFLIILIKCSFHCLICSL